MYTPFDLSGRGAVVTGGNGGIGLGMARALLAAGAKVAIWGSNPDKTERARVQLADECGDAQRVSCLRLRRRRRGPGGRQPSPRRPRRWAGSTPASPTPACRARARR